MRAMGEAEAMIRTFVQTREFSKCWDRLGFTYLITIYSKNEKDTLSMQECNNIRKVIEALEQSLAGGRK